MASANVVRSASRCAAPIPRPSKLAIKVAHHNAVSAVENLLRGSFLKRLVFDTPFFRLCLFGAKTYYRIWTFFKAEQAWRSVESHPVYGPQWRGCGRAEEGVLLRRPNLLVHHEAGILCIPLRYHRRMDLWERFRTRRAWRIGGIALALAAVALSVVGWRSARRRAAVHARGAGAPDQTTSSETRPVAEWTDRFTSLLDQPGLGRRSTPSSKASASASPTCTRGTASAISTAG